MEAIQERSEAARPGVPVGEWAELYEAELHRHVTRMLGNREEALDVVQELWVTALRSPPDDGDGSNVRAWLYRVATRRALDVISGRRRRGALLERRSPELEPTRPPPPDAAFGKLSEASAELVRRRVAELPCRQRDAVWLRWIEGKDYATIADRLGGTEQAARANVYQGLKRLRRELAGVWMEEGST